MTDLEMVANRDVVLMEEFRKRMQMEVDAQVACRAVVLFGVTLGIVLLCMRYQGAI